MKKIFLLAAAVCALFISGCGYRVGSLMHPQIKSIAIAPVSNDTMLYNASAQMRGALAECFQTDGSLKVAGEGTADCILYAKVTNAVFHQITWENNANDDDDEFIPDQWQVTHRKDHSDDSGARRSARARDHRQRNDPLCDWSRPRKQPSSGGEAGLFPGGESSGHSSYRALVIQIFC